MLTPEVAEARPFSPPPWTVGADGLSICSGKHRIAIAAPRSEYTNGDCRLVCAAPRLYEAWKNVAPLVRDSTDISIAPTVETESERIRWLRAVLSPDALPRLACKEMEVVISAAQSFIASESGGAQMGFRDFAGGPWTGGTNSCIIMSALPGPGYRVARVDVGPCRDANHMLIRAAPTLYESCECALGWLDRNVDRAGDGTPYELRNELLAALNAADEGP